ncbi:MAG: PDZ domain-containing protein [Deltaproteobacteria bacterium]|nr:PDZ domain-containing protein [Deltaproteobacteria bacterium]
MRRPARAGSGWLLAATVGLLCGLPQLAPAAADDEAVWRHVEEVIKGVAGSYYTVPDPDLMLRGALAALVQALPGAAFDGRADGSYRVLLQHRPVLTLSRPSDSGELVAAIVKATGALAREGRWPRHDLVEAALRGAVSGLGNCWTVYLTREMVRHLSFTPGALPADVGISLLCGTDGRVRHVRPGSPGYLAGIETGDQILAVNNRPCSGMDAAEIFALLSGPSGSRVQIGVTRASGVGLTVELVRQVREIDRPRAVELSRGAVLYLRPGPMHEGTSDTIGSQLKCGSRAGIVLDLRGNEGGRVDEAERFVRRFVGPGPIATIEGRNQSQRGRLAASETGDCAGVPIAVLVDRETASAAELIAQALRERRRALLIGQPTFGKGSVQEVLDFEGGAKAKVTVARYLSPSGRPLDTSLQPDLTLPDPGVYLGARGDPLIDPVVRAALESLFPGRSTAPSDEAGPREP